MAGKDILRRQVTERRALQGCGRPIGSDRRVQAYPSARLGVSWHRRDPRNFRVCGKETIRFLSVAGFLARPSIATDESF